MIERSAARIALFVILGAASAACAAAPAKSAQAPESAAPSAQAYGQQPGAYPSTPATTPAGDRFAPPPPPSAPGSAAAPAQPQGGVAGTSSRSVALQSASSEIEASQRELDVAAGDCRNACRALGSMDRAAGKVCELSQGEPDGHRCDDAKKRVYTARDRVKTTCGGCPGGPSVERTAPVPSSR